MEAQVRDAASLGSTSAGAVGQVSLGNLVVGQLRPVVRGLQRVRELVLDKSCTGLAIGALELHDVVLPYELLGLTLCDLGIDSIDVPTIEVV